MKAGRSNGEISVHEDVQRAQEDRANRIETVKEVVASLPGK